MQEIVANIPIMSQEKKWFLFIGPHHTGPFNQDQIIDLYKKNKINAESMLFCAGMSEWRALNTFPEWRQQLILDLDERETVLKQELSSGISNAIAPQIKEERLKELLNAPALLDVSNIPPAPKPPSSYFQAKEISKMFSQIPPKKKIFKKAEFVKMVETPPPLPEYPTLEKVAVESIPETEKTIPKDLPLVTNEEEKELSGAISFKTFFIKGLLISFTLTIMGLIAATIIFSPKEDPKAQTLLSELNSSQKAKLLLITRETSLPFLKVGLEYISDKKNKVPQFLMAFNRQGPFEMSATLTSLPKKILSLTEVKMQTKSQTGLHLAHFNKWVMLSGAQFDPGFYALDLNLEAKGFINNFIKRLQEVGIFNFIPLINNYKNTYRYHGLFWLGVPNEKVFEQNLAQFYKKLLDEKSQPLQDHLEQWKTINMILENLKTSFLSSLRRMKSGKDYRIYEKIYAKSVAGPLQQLMLMYIKDKRQGEPIFIVAKDIGKLAADMSDLIQSKNRFTNATKRDLQKTFEENWIVTFNSSLSQINKIEKELKSIQEEYSLE